jgi:hypothetical protein
MVILAAALVTGCGDGQQKFTVRIEPGAGSYGTGCNWEGTIELYFTNSLDHYEREKHTEVLTVSGSGPKTYEVRAKGVCVQVNTTTRGCYTWAYIDYNSSFGKMTESDYGYFLNSVEDDRVLMDDAHVCAYSE